MRLSRLLLSVIAGAIFLAARKSRAYKRLRVRMRLLLLVGTIALLCSVHAQTPPVSASPPLEQRVADLEAYINNSPRGADTKSATASNIAGPGPSYNAWIMTCAALVLALAPDGIAANAFMTTTLATAVASFTWAMLEYMLRGKPSVLGFCSGAVAGLVVITPACGYVAATGAVIVGIAAGILPFFACTKLKSWLGYDDALDTFGIHAVGGTLGAFLTGIFATASVNSNLSLSTGATLNPATPNGLARIVGHTLWIEQLKAIVVTMVLAVVGSAVIGAVVRAPSVCASRRRSSARGWTSINAAKRGTSRHDRAHASAWFPGFDHEREYER